MQKKHHMKDMDYHISMSDTPELAIIIGIPITLMTNPF